MNDAILILSNINKSFGENTAVKNFNLSLERGKIIAISGRSGAGKSTLLQIAGLLGPPDSGEVIVDNHSCLFLLDDKLTELRRRYTGFVYQFHYLMNEFSIKENIVIAGIIKGLSKKEASEQADQLLEEMLIHEKAHEMPSKISGGERQRGAIARALIGSPPIIIADEPTGNLDHLSSEVIFRILSNYVRKQNNSLLLATHSLTLLQLADQVIEL